MSWHETEKEKKEELKKKFTDVKEYQKRAMLGEEDLAEESGCFGVGPA